MIDLYNTGTIDGRVTSNILRVKDIEFNGHITGSPLADPTYPLEPTLVHDHIVVHGALILATYINQRYPAPALLPQGPAAAANTLMLYRRLLDVNSGNPINFKLFADYLKGSELMQGKTPPTLLDVALFTIAPEEGWWNEYRNYMRAHYNCA